MTYLTSGCCVTRCWDLEFSFGWNFPGAHLSSCFNNPVLFLLVLWQQRQREHRLHYIFFFPQDLFDWSYLFLNCFSHKCPAQKRKRENTPKLLSDAPLSSQQFLKQAVEVLNGLELEYTSCSFFPPCFWLLDCWCLSFLIIRRPRFH